jgi:hypothetical protein
MDPIGLALENFDLVGRWRDSDNGHALNTRTSLVDGTAIDGPVALRNALLARGDTLVTTLTEKLLTYALGRGVEAHDMPAVRAIVRNAAGNGYRFSDIVLGIAKSAPFRMNTATAVAEIAALEIPANDATAERNAP